MSHTSRWREKTRRSQQARMRVQGAIGCAHAPPAGYAEHAQTRKMQHGFVLVHQDGQAVFISVSPLSALISVPNG